MKAKIICLLYTLSIFSFGSSFAANETQMQTTGQGNNAEVVTWIITVDKHEIDAAKIALKKSNNPDIKDYATMLQKDHNKNLQETLKLSRKLNEKPLNTPIIKKLKDNGKHEMSMMKPLKHNEFQHAFINSMVKDHTNALKQIDNDLMPNVNNDELKQHLSQTRDTIAQHLEQAQAIQNKMQS